MILPSSLFKFKYKNLTAGYDFFLFHINSGSDFKVKGEHIETAIVVDDDNDGSTIFHGRFVQGM